MFCNYVCPAWFYLLELKRRAGCQRLCKQSLFCRGGEGKRALMPGQNTGVNILIGWLLTEFSRHNPVKCFEQAGTFLASAGFKSEILFHFQVLVIVCVRMLKNSTLIACQTQTLEGDSKWLI